MSIIGRFLLLIAEIILMLKPSFTVDHVHGSTLINSGERGQLEAFLFTNLTSQSHEKNSLLFFKDEFLEIFSQLRNRVNDTLEMRNALVKKYSSQGMSPTVTFITIGWVKSYEFNHLVENDNVYYWTMNISKLKLLQEFDSSNPGKTHWTYKVELGKGLDLFESWGSVVFSDAEPLLSVKLGDEVEEANVAMAPEDAIFWQHPCSLGVALLTPVRKTVERPYTGCYVAVTYGSFTPNTTRWFNLLHLSSGKPDNFSICKEPSFASCEKLAILDLSVVDKYILIVTSRGLIKSVVDAVTGTNNTKLQFDKVNSTHTLIDEAFDTESVKRSEIKLQHSAQCYGHELVAAGYMTYLVYTPANKDSSLLLSSEPPFEEWSRVVLPSSLAGCWVRGAAWDIQRSTTVLLLQDLVKSHSMVAVLDPKTSQLLQPVFQFPQNVTLTSIAFHAHTHSIFVYGFQVWLSIDGGNSFNQVLGKDLRGDVVSSLFSNSLGDAFVLVTKLGAVFSGLSGVPRVSLVEPASTTPYCNVKVVTFQRQNFVDLICLRNTSEHTSVQTYPIDLKSRVQAHVKLLFRPLLVQFKTEREVEFAAFCDDGFFTDNVHCTESFHPNDVGRVLKSRDGGSAVITRVGDSGVTSEFSARATGLLLTPFAQVNNSESPVLHYPLHVNLTGSTAILRLQNSLNDTGWRGEDIGLTVQLSNGVNLIITASISKSDATAKSLTPWSYSNPYVRVFEEGAWFLLDFRPFQASRPLGSAVLHVNHTGVDRAEVRVFNSEFAFMNEDMGRVLKCGSGWGLITSIISNSTSVVKFHNITSGNHTNDWGLYNATFANNSYIPYIPNPELKNWWLGEGECKHFLVPNPHSELQIQHLDSNEELSFTLLAVSKGIVDENPNKPLLRLYIGNALLFFVESSHRVFRTNHTMHVSLRKRPFLTGISSVTVRFHQTASLLCQEASFTVHGGCPPTKRLRFLYPLTFSQTAFLNTEVTDRKGIVRNLKLPYNYRAPSSRGKAIPMSKNIYNVNPQKPLYKTTYAVTRDTLRYKQCHGKTHRSECGCDSDVRASSLVTHSDCIDTVYRVMFSETLTPRFVVLHDRGKEQPLSFPFYLEEVNKRKDFTVISPSDLKFSTISSPVLSQHLNSSIQFDGSGLYHFRARVVQENYTFCSLTDEFVVFVVHTPLPFPVNDVVRACTGMGFACVLFIVYTMYFHGKKKMKND